MEKLKDKLLSVNGRAAMAAGAAFFIVFYLMLIFGGTFISVKSAFKISPSFNLVVLLNRVASGATGYFLIALAVAFLASVIVFKKFPRQPARDARGLKLSKNQTQGSDHLMTHDEKRREFEMTSFDRPCGLILGREKGSGMLLTVPFEGRKAPVNGNVLIVGKSGSRKTSAVLLPNIFSCIQSGFSCVCTDPKGELYAQSSAAARAQGYNIRILNLMNGEFIHSDGWDVLKSIREATDPVQMADLVVNVISTNLSDSDSLDFWEQANRNLLKAALLAVAKAANYVPRTSTDNAAKGRTLAEVYNLISADDTEDRIKKLLASSDYNKELLGPSFTNWATHSQKDSIKAGLATKLSVFQSKMLSRVLSEDEINFSELNDKKTMLYIICSDKDSTYQCILALISTMLFYQVTEIADKSPERHLKRPLYFFFEEFRNVGYIPDLSKKIATLRSRHVNMVFCYQNINQLKDTYSTPKARNEYETIIANCAVTVCCGSGDQETNRFFSDKSGEMTIDEKSTTIASRTFGPEALKFNPRGNIRTQAKGRAVLLESEIAKIQPDEILIIKTGCNPTIEQKYFYKYHPMYQYQAVNDDGEICPPSHLQHIPLWHERDIENEAAALTGSHPKLGGDEIHVMRFEGLNTQEQLKEAEESFSKKRSAAEKFADLIYESNKETENYFSSKGYEHFIREEEK